MTSGVAQTRVGVIGAGTMGRGIAQVSAAAGFPVLLLDARAGAVEEARAAIGKSLDRLVEKGTLGASDALSTKERLRPAGALSDLKDCDLIVEVIVEDIAAKTSLFAELDRIAADTAILASNTSSLSITRIAAATRSPGRVAGLHFFNPPPLMKLVEVVRGFHTSPEVVERLVAIAKIMGKVPVVCEDSPGFLVNHAGRGYMPEALRIVTEGICAPADVDAVMRDQAGFRMGPFELLDLVGMDIAQGVMEEIYSQYYSEAAYRPSVMGRQRVDAGVLGRKSGRGFYAYIDGKPEARDTPAPAPLECPPVWVSGAEPEARERLHPLLEASETEIDSGDRPAAGSACVVTPYGGDVSGEAVALGLDPKRTLGVDLIGNPGRHVTLMANPLTDPALRQSVASRFAAKERAVTVIADSPGFVAQRILAMIVNVGCNIAQRRIAPPAEIDMAVKLGLNYPRGPLEWGDAIGPARVLEILSRMHAFYLDPCYRPSPWLTRRARLGVSLLTPDS